MKSIQNNWQRISHFISRHFMLIILIILAGWFLWDDEDQMTRFQSNRGGNIDMEYAMDMADEAEESRVSSKMMALNSVREASFGSSTSGDDGMIIEPPLPDSNGFAPDQDRKIIKNGNITVQVEDTDASRTMVEKKMEDFGGAVTNMHSWEMRPGILAYNLTTRVPSERLEEVMMWVASLGTKTNENFSSQDITANYQDTESRLANLRVRRDRLREMMERQTDKLADVLQIDRELSQVQLQIENFERLQLRRNTDIDFSILHITINPEPQIGDFQNPEWSVGRSWKHSVNDLFHSFQNIIDKALVIIVYIPIWLPIVLILWWARRKFVD